MRCRCGGAPHTASTHAAMVLPTASKPDSARNEQVVKAVISSNKTNNRLPDLKLCLKKVEYAAKRGERERLR